jgi:hypothetical protein
MNAFKSGRRLREGGPKVPPLEDELAPCGESIRRKADLMLWAVANLPSRLFICYVPLIDEYNHAYMDLLEGAWAGRGDPAAGEVLSGCVGLVDGFLERLMEAAGEDTLLVISSDHGSMPVRRKVLLNEVLADAGLVVRAPGGYRLGRSLAYYHPSDCGQVLLNPAEARRRAVDAPAVRRRVVHALERANRALGCDIAWVEGRAEDPYLLFLYPRSDTTFTGDPPRRPGDPLLLRKRGGHHLSPLSPSPWMAAVFAAWTRRRQASLPAVPDANAGVKDFVLACLGVE